MRRLLVLAGLAGCEAEPTWQCPADLAARVEALEVTAGEAATEQAAQWERIDTNYDTLAAWIADLGCRIDDCEAP